MKSYVSRFYHHKGPDLLARFYVAEGQICQIELSLNSQAELAWQMCSDNPAPDLETQISHWMKEYANKQVMQTQLPLLLQGLSPFTLKVLKQLKSIPFGKSLSYKELAQSIDSPKASRAVGSACGRNPFPLVIPCHRILASDKKLGGFACGLEIKQRLLQFEEIM